MPLQGHFDDIFLCNKTPLSGKNKISIYKTVKGFNICEVFSIKYIPHTFQRFWLKL